MSFIFNANEDPKQRQLRQQRQMDAAQAGFTNMPQDVGQGIGAVAQALNYRRLKGQQAQAPVGGPVAPGADPWSGMRQGGGALSSIMNLFR